MLADARDAYARREAEIDEIIGTQGGMRELERQVLLQVMDRKWREHLYEMDYLKEGIGLRAMAQRDPLIEYQREGFDMFAAMLEGIKEETVGHLFNVRVQAAAPAEGDVVAEAAPDPVPDAPQEASPQVADPQEASPRVADPQPAGRHATTIDDPEQTGVLPNAFRGAPAEELSYSGPSEDGEAVRSRPAAASGNGQSTAPSRNRPCPCGSGRKYKQCHGSPTAARP